MQSYLPVLLINELSWVNNLNLILPVPINDKINKNVDPSKQNRIEYLYI
jgi:hypothetical protein